ncbi:MAG: hypothetical protein WCS65_11025, partial [Verrucomicrobiae bacterium]
MKPCSPHHPLCRLFLHVFTVCLMGSSASATITINETWVTDPGTDAKTAWAAVETYYQNVFSPRQQNLCEQGGSGSFA